MSFVALSAISFEDMTLMWEGDFVSIFSMRPASTMIVGSVTVAFVAVTSSDAIRYVIIVFFFEKAFCTSFSHYIKLQSAAC